MWVKAIGEGRTIHYLRASKIVEFWVSKSSMKVSMPLRKLNIRVEGSNSVFKLYYPEAPQTRLDIWVLDNFKLIPYLDDKLPQFTVSWDNLTFPYTDLGAVALIEFLKTMSERAGVDFEDILNYYHNYDKDPITIKGLRESLPFSIYELGDLQLFKESITGGFYGSRIFKEIEEGKYTIKDPFVVLSLKKELENIKTTLEKFSEVYSKELNIQSELEEAPLDGS